VDACTFLALVGLPCLVLVLAILPGLIGWAARG
jgi:hypothetical protein